ncbi:MAG: hypothetical protein CMJ32_08130 [Phycisphaerae bacterium]|nr:hypothetical protein [Phycisphaerae bacterium]
MLFSPKNPRIIGASALAICISGLAAIPEAPATPESDPPEKIDLIGVVRDFKERTVEGGHPDFEKRPRKGFGLYCGNISPNLGSDGKPVFTGNGFKVYPNAQWTNASGQNICFHLYNPSLGDQAGYPGPSCKGGIKNSESFNQWYRDVLGVNTSTALILTLERSSDGSYVFDSDENTFYQSLGGFFPVEGQLFGNPGGVPDRNFHFTFELHTEFTYDANGAQVFTFRGDDDVWVFIDGKMVIDLGGVHGAIEQVVELDRLGLTDGEVYNLDFFFAERHRSQSNFRIQTNLLLETVQLPTVSTAFD